MTTKPYSQVDIEYVYDNTITPALNIWKGLRYKAYFDWYTQLTKCIEARKVTF